MLQYFALYGKLGFLVVSFASNTSFYRFDRVLTYRQGLPDMVPKERVESPSYTPEQCLQGVSLQEEPALAAISTSIGQKSSDVLLLNQPTFTPLEVIAGDHSRQASNLGLVSLWKSFISLATVNLCDMSIAESFRMASA
jgi:hypothetical protein